MTTPGKTSIISLQHAESFPGGDRMAEGFNPLTGMDYPDPDVIRVGDTYYMVSTTMRPTT